MAIRAGALWVATNTDRTLPSGARPAARQRGAGRRAAYRAGAGARRGGRQARAGAVRVRRRSARCRAPLVVGDRLDTDIEGAVRAGLDSLLVLTGVSTVDGVLAAPATRRPTYIARDLGGLVAPGAALPVPVVEPGNDTADDGWAAVRALAARLRTTASARAETVRRGLAAEAPWRRCSSERGDQPGSTRSRA